MTTFPTLEDIAESIRLRIHGLRDSGDLRQIDMLSRQLRKIEELQQPAKGHAPMDIARHIATSDGRPR